MSTDDAIAGVTSVLRSVLTDALVDTPVTAKPLDEAQPSEGTNRVNLLLYQVTPNAAFSNLPMPGVPNSRPPLALNLHYLLTVYGADDGNDVPVNAQRLLGTALRTLVDYPELSREKIRTLAPESHLDQQIDRVRITPHTLTLEEISRAWPAFQTPYRLSAAFEASCVLIESARRAPAPMPVLRRGPEDRGAEAHTGPYPFPLITAVNAGPEERPLPAARIGDQITVTGENLAPEGQQTVVLRMRHDATGWQDDVPVDPASATKLTAVIQDGAGINWRCGTIMLSAVIQAAAADVHESNQLPFVLAPRITNINGQLANIVVISASGAESVTVNVDCKPPILANQEIAGLWGSREVTAEPTGSDPSTVAFTLTRPNDAPTSPAASLRLRVAGADSLPFRLSEDGEGFEVDPAQQVEVHWP